MRRLRPEGEHAIDVESAKDRYPGSLPDVLQKERQKAVTVYDSFDTETSRITNLDKCPPMVCLSWATAEQAGLFHVRDNAWKAWLYQRLTKGYLSGANIAYDMCVVIREEPDFLESVWQAYADNRVVCTQMNERLIDIERGRGVARPYNLDVLVEARFGHVMDKDPEIRLNYGPLRDVPLDQWSERQRTYPVEDAKWDNALVRQQGDDPGPDRWNRARTSFALQLASIWGFRTDLPRVYRLRGNYERELKKAIDLLAEGVQLPTGKAWKMLKENPEALQKALLEAPLIRAERKTGGVFGWTRNEAAARAQIEAIYRQMGQEPRQTPGEVPSIDDEACLESGDPVFKAYSDYSSITKRLGYDLKALATGEVHPGYIALQTNGRTASRGPDKQDKTGLLAYNAQNMPVEGGERECIVPRPGHKFLIVDMPGFEMRTWAQVCLDTVGQSVLADYLNDPTKDPHSAIGCKLAGVSYEYFMANLAEKRIADSRDTGKKCNFGMMADMGAKRFVATCRKKGIKIAPTYEEEIALAYKWKAMWKTTWPESFLYFEHIQSLGEGCAITQFVTGRVRGGCSYTDACNGYFSSLANDCAQAILFTLQRECYDPSRNSILFGCRVVLFPHDEFVVEAPDDGGLHERAVRLKQLCDEGAKPFVPDINVSTKPCVANRYSKFAKPLYDGNHRLVPWDVKEVV